MPIILLCRWGCLHLAEISRVRAARCIYTCLAQGGYAQHLVWFWNRVEHGSYCLVCCVLSGSQSCGLKMQHADDAFGTILIKMCFKSGPDNRCKCRSLSHVEHGLSQGCSVTGPIIGQFSKAGLHE